MRYSKQSVDLNSAKGDEGKKRGRGCEKRGWRWVLKGRTQRPCIFTEHQWLLQEIISDKRAKRTREDYVMAEIRTPKGNEPPIFAHDYLGIMTYLSKRRK